MKENAAHVAQILLHCILEMNECEPSLLKQKLTNATSVKLTVPFLKKCDLKFELAQHYFSKKALLVYAVFRGKNNTCKELQCSITFLLLSIDKTNTFSNMVGHSFKKMQPCFATECLFDFSGIGR